MLATLYYLSGFNNYYSRQIKMPLARTVDEFLPWSVITTKPTNFNPTDGVDTAIDVNYNGLDDAIELDYLVVSSDNVNVDSKWFVVERKRNLTGQWSLTLHRDLMAEYFNEVCNSPVFIEKARLSLGNKLIFNKEGGITYNQIKKSEALLKDETGSGWLVGYLANNHEEKSFTISTADKTYPAPPIEYSTINNWVNNNKANINFAPSEIRYRITASKTDINAAYGSKARLWEYTYNSKGGLWSSYDKDAGDSRSNLYAENVSFTEAEGRLGEAIKAKQATLLPEAETLIRNGIAADSNFISASSLATLQNMSGSAWEQDGIVFTVGIEKVYTHLATKDITSNSGALFNTMLGIYRDDADIGAVQTTSGHTRVEGFKVQYFQDYYNITLNVLSATPADCTIKTSVNKLEDAPYKMFAIPYNNLSIRVGDTSYNNNSNVAKRLASSIATTYGGTGQSFLYDIQLLPYCPLRNAVVSNGVDLSDFTVDIDYTLASAGGTPQTVILWAEYSNFNLSIDYSIQVPQDSAIEFKVDNETKFVRLCSPNYSGAFEFKPTMNYGVSSFEVNCTYKPYQPYIHISPVFNSDSLYGGDYTDQRGLVCTGDFSIPVANDAWINYQIQNKSYEDSFNRQIENMETTYDINRKQAKTAGIIGSITAALGAGAGAGMVAQPFLGGVGGLAVGGATAAAAAATSLVGLSADLKAMDALHQESLSYAEDQYGYQLQNIKALPYTLGKVGAFTINNKIFPFLEFYEASTEEMDALRSKLKYNGFTVMTIGKISDYIAEDETFVQGQLIRLLPYDDNFSGIDYHTAVSIANELHKGVYI